MLLEAEKEDEMTVGKQLTLPLLFNKGRVSCFPTVSKPLEILVCINKLTRCRR